MPQVQKTAIQLFAAETAKGKVKSLPANVAASIAAGLPLELILPFVTSSGYCFKVLSFAPDSIKLFVLSHETKNTTTPFEKVVTLKPWGVAWKADDSRISSAKASKLADTIPSLLFRYPLGLLAERGFYPKESLAPTLALVLEDTARKKKVELSSEDALLMATAMVSLMEGSRLYGSASPAQMVSYLEAKFETTPALEGAE